jgi:hypothetical protein
MSRLTLATPWNAVVAVTESIAEQYIDAFGLSREMWARKKIDDAATGWRLHRIVIIRPHWHLAGAEYSSFQIAAQAWMSRVAPDGHFKII